MKTLIISHNSFNNKNNMGQTLCRLFYNTSKEELSQIFFHQLNPNVDKCISWYKMTDIDAIKSIFFRGKCGKPITLNIDQKDANQGSSVLGVNKSSFKLLIRDIIWLLSSWNNKKIHKWIEEFKPEVIFFVPGYSKFIYNITMKISKKYNIPIVTYFADDYYVEHEESNKILDIIKNKLLNKKIYRIVQKSKKIIFISDLMRKKYFDIFKKDGEVVMTPFDYKIEKDILKKDFLKMMYIGNLGWNRWQTVEKIGIALNEINKQKRNIVLEVYSGYRDENVIKRLKNINSIDYKGYIETEKANEKMKEADILLHVESYDQESIKKVKNSISTKIPNYLMSNRYILAVGPEELASIKYLKENNVAYVIQNEEDIEAKIKEYFVENQLNKEYVYNAIKLAENNHDIKKNSNLVIKIINDCIERKPINENNAS